MDQSAQLWIRKIDGIAVRTCARWVFVFVLRYLCAPDTSRSIRCCPLQRWYHPQFGWVPVTWTETPDCSSYYSSCFMLMNRPHTYSAYLSRSTDISLFHKIPNLQIKRFCKDQRRSCNCPRRPGIHQTSLPSHEPDNDAKNKSNVNVIASKQNSCLSINIYRLLLVQLKEWKASLTRHGSAC